MDNEEINLQIGDARVHTESGRKVIILNLGKMLDDGRWTRAVTYRTLDNGQEWTRTRNSFLDKFQ